MPTVSASGLTSLTSWSCSSTGLRSEVPVTLPPGLSLVSTSPASSASVTAVKSTGTFVIACAAACAAGVATARTRSKSPFAKVCAIEVALACSP